MWYVLNFSLSLRIQTPPNLSMLFSPTNKLIMYINWLYVNSDNIWSMEDQLIFGLPKLHKVASCAWFPIQRTTETIESHDPKRENKANNTIVCACQETHWATSLLTPSRRIKPVLIVKLITSLESIGCTRQLDMQLVSRH